jgi:hypothetical protein
MMASKYNATIIKKNMMCHKKLESGMWQISVAEAEAYLPLRLSPMLPRRLVVALALALVRCPTGKKPAPGKKRADGDYSQIKKKLTGWGQASTCGRQPFWSSGRPWSAIVGCRWGVSRYREAT